MFRGAVSNDIPTTYTLSVIVPAWNCPVELEQCLLHLQRSSVQPHEVIVVDDGSTDETPRVAERLGAKLLRTAGRTGPAHARNVGAKAATGDLLLFVDADVCVHVDTVERFLQTFSEEPRPDCVIGSYDANPASPDFLSQYRNLMHCYTHQTARREACTFWSGCGALWRDLFLEHSGFSESYTRPAIEDIELGYRLRRAGCRMIIDRDILCTHLKRWTFWNIVKTDVLDRGVPWTELILRESQMPNDLNLQISQRVSTALAFILVMLTAAGAALRGAEFLLPLLLLLLLVLCTYWVELAAKPTKGAWAALIAAGGSAIGLAYAAGKFWMLPPLFSAFLLLLARHRYSMSKSMWHKISGLMWGAYVAIVAAFMVIYLPMHPIVLSIFLVLIAMMVLNIHFYVFLAGRVGYLYALAAVPFHMLYHFYNGLSFMVGNVRFRTYELTQRAKLKQRRTSPGAAES